ncbi:MAG TPA: hypothetical protein VLA93_06375 [Pyrinomonadaceae bacterium]|nr:hypothetical protein [Pyrinomonadaceae bacterium]
MNRQFKTLLLVSVTAVVFITIAQAQSGRRQTRPAPAAPVPTPTPDPTPPPKPEAKSDLGFLVGIDRNDGFNYLPLTFYSTAMHGCADRLRHNSSATVTTADRLTRADAIKKAKAEKTTYVVYLRFTTISMADYSNEQAELEFIVYAPVTGKVATSGRSYQNANSKGPIVVQPPRGGTNTIYQEQMLRRAAEDAADRILKALHIVSGSV